MKLADLAILVGMCTSLVAIIGLALEIRSSRLALQTQALLNLEGRFYSSRMTSLRQAAARNLLTDCKLNPELEDVLDFLHTVCMLVERNVVDRELAIEFYQYWIARYWLASEPYIQKVRAIDDPKTYSKLERFAREIIQRNADVNYSEEAMRVFLLKEVEMHDENA